MALTREQIFGASDLERKEVKVPEWGGDIYIRQLTRGEQDAYLKRQFGDTRVRQNRKADNQEFTAVNIYGHDAFIVVCAACDENGKPLFKPSDEAELAKKNGEVVGRLAKEIIEFSGMKEDAAVAKGEKTEEQAVADELKN